MSSGHDELPPNKGPKRKIMIVIEDNGQENGRGFNLYMEGDKERIGKTAEKDLCPAEWWGGKLFLICIDAVNKANAIKSKTDRETGKPIQ